MPSPRGIVFGTLLTITVRINLLEELNLLGIILIYEAGFKSHGGRQKKKKLPVQYSRARSNCQLPILSLKMLLHFKEKIFVSPFIPSFQFGFFCSFH